MNKKYSGLSDKDVVESRKKYGSNEIKKNTKNSFIKLLIESLNDPIIKILIFALAIKIIFLFKDSNIYETLGIAVAIFLASFISAISEYGSEKAFERLSEENNKITVSVIRNYTKKIISMSEIVVGDIILLKEGDKVPADGIILEGSISVDESVLTGESEEKSKNINETVYMGSIICENSAIIKVTLVGENTFYGKVASEIQASSSISPLKSKLTSLAKLISKIGYIGAILIFFSYMINSVIIPYNFDLKYIFDLKIIIPHLIYALTLSVAVVVMAVPEGLPMMITLVLSSNMKKLLKRNVLVRKLVGIETSGSLNILFTDKTGTLTEGNLKVNCFIDSNFKKYNDNKYVLGNEIIYQSLIYNNDSFLINGIAQGGNTTDRAILNFVNNDLKDKYKILKNKHFSSKDKYSSVTTNFNNRTTFFKGAYEIILSKSKYYLDENNNKRIIINKNKYESEINEFANKGYRVLALAISDNDVLDNLILVGFIILKDNIRREAYKGIDSIKKAGVLVVMVTGDAKKTAVNVANELNIIENDSDIVLTSEEFNRMSDSEIKSKLSNIKVLCRSLPQDKNRLVNLALENDMVVGMTGDGINDAPALKKASVGFSMGSGCEIAKETSDIVIIDNNILSISYAILYGRTIFKSIRKFIIFQLSVNCCAVFLSIIGPFIGILSPITVTQVLWVNMVMDTFAGLAFSFEPALNEYMNEKPKKKNENIVNKYMLNQILFDGLFSMCLCIWFLKSKYVLSLYSSYDHLMTAFFGLFIFIDIFIAFNSRTHRINTFANIIKNKIFLVIFLFITIVQILLIYYGGEIFRTTGLYFKEFEFMILISSLLIPFDIIRKIILKRKRVDMGV